MSSFALAVVLLLLHLANDGGGGGGGPSSVTSAFVVEPTADSDWVVLHSPPHNRDGGHHDDDYGDLVVPNIDNLLPPANFQQQQPSMAPSDEFLSVIMTDIMTDNNNNNNNQQSGVGGGELGGSSSSGSWRTNIRQTVSVFEPTTTTTQQQQQQQQQQSDSLLPIIRIQQPTPPQPPSSYFTISALPSSAAASSPYHSNPDGSNTPPTDCRRVIDNVFQLPQCRRVGVAKICPTDSEIFRYLLLVASNYQAVASADSAERLIPVVRHIALLYSDSGRDSSTLRNTTLMDHLLVAARGTMGTLDGRSAQHVLIAMRPLLIPDNRGVDFVDIERGEAYLPTIPTDLALQMDLGVDAVAQLRDSMGEDSIAVMLSMIRLVGRALDRPDYARFWKRMRKFLLDLEGEPGGEGAKTLARNIATLQVQASSGGDLSAFITEAFAPGFIDFLIATNFTTVSGAMIAPFSRPFLEGTGATLDADDFDMLLDITRKVLVASDPAAVASLAASVQRRTSSMQVSSGRDALQVVEAQILNMMTMAQMLAVNHDESLFATTMQDVFEPLVFGLVGDAPAEGMEDLQLQEGARLLASMLDAVLTLYESDYASVVSPETMDLLLRMLHAVALRLDTLTSSDLDVIRSLVVNTSGSLNGALLEATLCLSPSWNFLEPPSPVS